MIRILYSILLCGLISFHTSAQKSPFLISLRDNWKLEIKTGTVTMLTPVPDIYLYRTNNMNIPIGIPGPLGIFSAKKCFTAHIEMGYQFDYLRVQGKALNVDETRIKVLTQIYTHTFQVQYNFIKNNEIKPPLNYFVSFKLGGISLKNDRLDSSAQGTHISSTNSGSNLISNVAILSGIGAGINYQLNSHLSLTGSCEVNKSADALNELFKIQKLFYSTNHGNNYMELTFGLSYWFNLSSKKKPVIKTSATKTTQQLIQSRIIKKKAKPKATNFSIWFDNQKGK